MNAQPDGTEDMMERVEENIGKMLQQPKIIGYRQLSAEDAALMNQIKELANEVGRMVEGMMLNPKCDTRWVATARTTLQTGFMQLTRSVAQPTSF